MYRVEKILYRTLGRSGIPVSLLSYGTGGPSQFGKHAGIDARGRARIVRRALELGVNLFDTAAGYGGGDAERWLGDALRGFDRDAYLLCTKWSWRPRQDGESPSEDVLIASMERSLKNLRTDAIDIMLLHGINQDVYDDSVARYAPILLDFKQRGKARLIGFSEMMTEDPRHSVPERALEEHHDLWDVIMLKYGILNQWSEKKALPLAQKHGVAILNMAPVRYTLTREAERRDLFRQWREEGEIDVDDPRLRDGFGWLVNERVPSVIAAGYKFAAAHPAISTVITGTSSIKHLEENVAAMEDPTLPAQDMALLKHLLSASASPR